LIPAARAPKHDSPALDSCPFGANQFSSNQSACGGEPDVFEDDAPTRDHIARTRCCAPTGHAHSGRRRQWARTHSMRRRRMRMYASTRMIMGASWLVWCDGKNGSRDASRRTGGGDSALRAISAAR